MRVAHIMKPNHKCETPHRAIWLACDFDTTVNSGKGVEYVLRKAYLRAGYLSSRSGVWVHRDIETKTAAAAFRAVTDHAERKTRTYLIVRNSRIVVAMLDAFKWFSKDGWRCTLAVIECPPTIVRWRKDDRTILMIDEANFWPTPSSDISDGEKDKAQCATGENAAPLPRGERIKRSVEEMSKRFQEWWTFLKKNDLGGFSATVGAQALRTFRHRFMKHPILIDNNEKACSLSRRAFVGGRTECLYIGRLTGTFYLLDVNSMYAAVMRQMKVPVRLIGYTERTNVDELRRWNNTRVCVAAVTVTTPLPVFAERGGKSLVFPSGTFNTVLAGEEITWALDQELVSHVSAAACYDHAHAFREYVDYVWSERAAARDRGDRAAYGHYKLLLASFYGKWGQTGGIWEKTSDTSSDEVKHWLDICYETGEVNEWRQFGGIVQHKSNEPEAYESHPAIAACITANARMLLWSYMVSAGLENVFYVDTDSLLVNELGLGRLQQYIAPDQLGGLRLEGRYSSIHIRGAKDYVFDDRTRRKGKRADAVVLSDMEVEQTEQLSPSSLIRLGDFSHAAGRRVRKKFVHNYDKGTIMASGRVVPLVRSND